MKLPNVALAYRESEALGASPVGVIVLLYDRLVRDIHRALAAMKVDQVEERSAQVNHALLILQQLQGRLDFVAGGATACQLDAFYSRTRAKLLEAQIRQSPELMREQAEALLQVRECWAEVERSMAAPSAPISPGAPGAAPSETPGVNLGA